MNELLSPSARTWAEIDMAALKHNYEIARATGKKVMCVIKADAYGHGAVRCGRYLEKCGADAFAVACLSEALELRQGGITKTILILGYTSHEYAKVLADNDITQTLVDESHALELNEAAKAANVTVKGHIKLDTGMSRAGLFAQGHDAAMKAAEAAERMSKLSNVKVTGMYTHFCVADTPDQDEFTAWQLENYKTVMNYLTEKGLRPETCHTSNSAGILYHPETQIDMVREGVILYGMYPDSMPQYGPLSFRNISPIIAEKIPKWEFLLTKCRIYSIIGIDIRTGRRIRHDRADKLYRKAARLERRTGDKGRHGHTPLRQINAAQAVSGCAQAARRE